MTARRARRGPHVPPAIMRLAARQLGGRALDPALPWPVSWPPCQLVVEAPPHDSGSPALVSALAVDLASVQAADQPLGGRGRALSVCRMVSSHCRVPGEWSKPAR